MSSPQSSAAAKRAGNRAGRRMQFTASPTQERVLRQAARTAGKPVSAFVADSSCAAAYQLLMNRPDFLLDDPDWEHFLNLLGQSPQEKDQLKALLQSDG
jgi:uncharacterized protein (DUF1778 family)